MGGKKKTFNKKNIHGCLSIYTVRRFFSQQTQHTSDKKTQLEATKVVKFKGKKIVRHETMRKYPKLNEFLKKKKGKSLR